MSSATSTELLAGPLLIGICVSCILFGVLSIQVYFYRKKFPNDKLPIQAIVSGIYVLEVLQVAFILQFAWDVFVEGYANPQALLVITWPDAVHSMLGAIIAGIVQLFFAWRVWSLRKENRFVQAVSILIILLALLQTLSGVVGSILFIKASSGDAHVDLVSLSTMVELWLISSFVCDVVIAAAMTGILVDYSRKSPIKRTQSLVKDLVFNSVETGTVTVVAAMVDLILFKVFPQNYLHLCFNTLLSKLYSNALLASLNARQSQAEGGSVYSNYLSSRGRVRDPTRSAATAIQLSTHTHVVTDSDYRTVKNNPHLGMAYGGESAYGGQDV